MSLELFCAVSSSSLCVFAHLILNLHKWGRVLPDVVRLSVSNFTWKLLIGSSWKCHQRRNLWMRKSQIGLIWIFLTESLPVWMGKIIQLMKSLPRDAMRKCGHCCRPVSSVRLSVTLVDCIQTAVDIFKLLCRPGSPIILVFFDPGADTKSKGTPSSGAQNTRGVAFFVIFDWNRHLSRIRYEIGPWLLWIVNRKSYALYRMVTFSMTLTDP